MPIADRPDPSLAAIGRAWGRIGCLGFGGPPAHVAMLRETVVERHGWIDAEAFEDAVAITNLLPGPGSTQLSILCAWRLRGAAGALVGGLAFVFPGLLLIVALAAAFLADAPPAWLRGAGAGAGAVVAAIALHAGWGLLGPSWTRAAGDRRVRWLAYVALGAIAAVVAGPWLVLVLLACGAAELAVRRPPRPAGDGASGAPGGSGRLGLHAWPLLAAAAVGAGGLGALAWTALKVGALSYGGGFVIVPLMQADAVDHHHWMSAARFLDAVALGQVTPGPVVHTVSAVGYAAAGIGGALLAAVVAFSPSFAVVLLGGRRLERLRGDARVRAFLDGAGPAALGAILGAAVPLAAAIGEPWQAGLLAAAVVVLLVLRGGVVTTLLGAGAVGALVAAAGGPLPT
ncbi:chromate efflux transporter [Patulibacter defluvii]|uniref:chromate efflux transporter n=1 Tax=Patulibacter defluvii TaxID=3095358 RepID=UPI002A75DA7B|nr:chromate efflux transporter [Patulibacter sp. DM4]